MKLLRRKDVSGKKDNRTPAKLLFQKRNKQHQFCLQPSAINVANSKFFSGEKWTILYQGSRFRQAQTPTVWGQKKPPKVNECSSVANYHTAMIFFLQSSQYSYVFFDGNFFCQEFVCLPFFCYFRLSRVQKGPKNTPRSTKFRF